MEITCTKCGDPKDETEFYFKNKKLGIRVSNCKTCTKKMTASHYERNKDYYKNRTKVNVKIKRDFYIEYKSLLKCERCPETHPAVLDFHHKDPLKKDISVSEMIHRNYSISKIKKEIKKCSVICSNCHRKLHWEEKNGPIV